MTQEDHDQRLKEAVKSKFSDAIDLLTPAWVPWFDYSKRMRLAEEAKAKAKADALQKIATSAEPEMRKYLLCECVEAYLPLEEVQMKEYDQLLLTPTYQGARKYGKTSYELGQLEFLRQMLACRFGPLSEATIRRLEACSQAQLLELGKKLLTATALSELGLEP